MQKKKTIAKKSASKAKPAKKMASKPAAKKAVKPAIVKAAKPVKKTLNGIPEQMRDEALKILDDRQAEDIVMIDLAGKSSMADYVIVASGRSARQVSAMAHYLREAFTKYGKKYVHVEGVSEGNWALVDGGDVVVHLFRPEVRSYYDLEAIWNKKSGSGHRSA